MKGWKRWLILWEYGLYEGVSMGKITVRNFTTLSDFSALIRAGLYLAGRIEEAEENGFCYKVSKDRRNGVVVKITESTG